MISDISSQVLDAHDAACDRFFREALCTVIPHRATDKFKRHQNELIHRLLFDLNIVLTRIGDTGDNLTHLTVTMNNATIATARVGICTVKHDNGKSAIEVLYTPTFMPAQRVPDHHPAIKRFISDYRRQTAAYIGKGKA